MTRQTRRQFVAQAAAGAIALGLGQTSFGQSQQSPQMTIVRWDGQVPASNAEIDRIAAQLTAKAIESMGGIQRFIRRQDVVWIKPNIAWDRTPELAANTNPAVVETLVRLCYEAGAKVVKVGDNPCNLAQATYRSSGIAEAARRAGAEVVFLDRTRVRNVAIRGERVKQIPMFPEILEADVLVNVPVAKHHSLATATLCMKNYMGTIEERRTFHQDISTCLADLTRFLHSEQRKLCVLDGIRVLLRHGPRGGNPADVAVKLTVATGVDIVALDAFGAELLGRKPEEIGSVVKGEQVGLGTKNYRSLNLKEITLS